MRKIYGRLKLDDPKYGFEKCKTGAMSGKLVRQLGFMQNDDTNDQRKLGFWKK